MATPAPPIPKTEAERLDILNKLDILDTLPEEEYDNITKLVAFVCDVPISLVSLLDDKRQWFKSRFGLEVLETERDKAFCAYTIAQDTPFIVQDAEKDERFAHNSLVTGHPDIRFYVGAQVRVGGQNIGSLCAIDRKPRTLSSHQIECLQVLAKHVSMLITFKKYENLSSYKLEEIVLSYNALVVDDKVQETKLGIVKTISHELKTPLNGIISTSESLLELLKNQDIKTKLAQTLQSSTTDLSTVFTNLMDASHNAIGLNPESVQLKNQACVLVENFKFKAEEKLITFEVTNTIAQDLVVYCDLSHFVSLISNLLDNAVKFTNPNGKISVTFQMNPSEGGGEQLFYFKVQDTGLGISPDSKKNVFTPLASDTSDTKTHKGAGNGLVVCKRIVDAMNGNIGFSSEEGVGSTFWCILPLPPNVETTRKRESLTSALIVDDNQLNITIAKTLLKKLVKGIEVDSAKNGQEGLEKALAKKYDLVLMDLQMPVLDGLGATIEIRKRYKGDDLLIFAFTASSENVHSSKCMDVGMNDIMTKPITFKQLKETVGKWFVIL